MKTLSEYILTTFIASIITGIGEKIAPTSMKKYITFVATLMILIFLVSPIKSVAEELFLLAEENLKHEQSEETDSISYDKILSISQKRVEKAIMEHMYDKYGIKDNLSISLAMTMEENGTILLTHITLKIGVVHSVLADDMRSYLEKTFS